MKYSKSYIYLSVVIFFLITMTIRVSAQEKRPIFIGLQPGYTDEPFYEKGELDINIIPITLLIPINKRFDFRTTTIVNYHFGGEQEGISDMGFQFVWPFYFKKKDETRTLSKGFYVGPVLGLGRNLINEHYTTILAIEPGYQFPTKRSFSLSLGIQLGGSYFAYDNQSNVWQNHFGFKANIGFWVNKGS